MKRLFSFNKKTAVVGLAVGLTLGGAGAAFAFFTQSGSQVGAVQDGSVTGWTIAFPGYVSTPLFPGGSAQTINYTATNTSGGPVQLNAVAVSVTHDGANEVYNTNTSAWVPGCDYSWFATSVDYSPGGANPVPAAGTFSGHAFVSLTDSGTNQNACIGVNPQITVSAS